MGRKRDEIYLPKHEDVKIYARVATEIQFTVDYSRLNHCFFSMTGMTGNYNIFTSRISIIITHFAILKWSSDDN
jgi:hypothetical protein